MTTVTLTPTGRTRLGTAAWVVAGRIVRSWGAQLPAMVIVWAFPVLVTVLFLALFGGALGLPAGAPYVDFLVPGMLAVSMLFGLETSTLASAADAATGVNDRLRSLPIDGAAVILGRCAADTLSSLITLATMVTFGLAAGWRPDPAGVPAALVLLLALRFSLLWIGTFIGYGARSVESVAYVQILVWPVAFLSSVFVDPATMPRWLGVVAEVNPVSATASAVRDLVGGTGWASVSPAGELATALAVAWPVLITAAFLPLAVRRFRQGGA
ncbi:ABC transporter permease [Georgenia faecalis]|uniref:Transport permease protein n=1 Tax=Georgenia faecalis TaxID=2483799 RepID=A0ABV9D9G4_9MICO|nr:ABC transporter permease [Georgenia faecalis]